MTETASIDEAAPEQPMAYGVLVADSHGQHVLHPSRALHVGEVLARLLHAGVQVADDGLAAKHGFALQFQHQAQHAVGTGVLRAHVDDHGLILGGICR